jgi:hypothetical protein
MSYLGILQFPKVTSKPGKNHTREQETYFQDAQDF